MNNDRTDVYNVFKSRHRCAEVVKSDPLVSNHHGEKFYCKMKFNTTAMHAFGEQTSRQILAQKLLVIPDLPLPPLQKL